MRRSFWSRIFAGWLACWLPLVLADVGRLHACPMHDGAPTAPAAAAMVAAMPHMASHMASAVGEHASHGARRAAQHSSRHATGHACTCLGACCAAMAVLPVRPAPVTFTAVERANVALTGRPQHEYVAAWVDFVLPFATAPPDRATA